MEGGTNEEEIKKRKRYFATNIYRLFMQICIMRPVNIDSSKIPPRTILDAEITKKNRATPFAAYTL